MFALAVAILATIILTPEVVLANEYTVWASVIFSRTGDRTPEVLGYIPTTLTSLGAQQAYDSGSFFRNRYICSSGSSDVFKSAPMQGLSANKIEEFELYVAALDTQYLVASAQAFVQGLYPPFTLNSTAASLLDPTSLLANGTYIESPLGGYQYPQVHAAGALDPDFPYLGGSLNCPAFDVAAIEYTTSPEFASTEAESKNLYESVGAPLLADVLDEAAWDYYNAYAIYDYIYYQTRHNASAAAILGRPQYVSPSTNASTLDRLRWYADQQQWARLGNLTKKNEYTAKSADRLPGRITGSISTIAGNLLAAKIVAQLQAAIETAGKYYKLSLLFGDFEPLLSFFALTGLPNINSNFYGIPDFGSVAVFELFSYTNNSMPITFPSTDDLWVQFYFRNGTGQKDNDNASGRYQSYPLFGGGPSETQMMWRDFVKSMYQISLGDIGTWCTQCGAESIFCAAWNQSDRFALTGNSNHGRSRGGHHVSPVVGGVIGAIVALVAAGLLFALTMLIVGLRFHRVERHKSEMGGFKGGQRMASDRDLTLPKGGAVVGASVERDPNSPISPIAQERVGSWELKSAEAGRPDIADTQSTTRRSSFEGEMRVDPFKDPIRADERV